MTLHPVNATFQKLTACLYKQWVYWSVTPLTDRSSIHSTPFVAHDTKPSGIAIFLLQREHGVNRSEIDLAPWLVRGAWQVDQQWLRTITLLRLLSRAAQPFADGFA